MDIVERLIEVLDKYGWTKYRLSKESKIPESTLSNIFHRGTVPTIATLQAICETMNISLAEFFSDDKQVVMTPELEEFYEEWILLTPEKRKHLIQSMKYFRTIRLASQERYFLEIQVFCHMKKILRIKSAVFGILSQFQGCMSPFCLPLFMFWRGNAEY